MQTPNKKPGAAWQPGKQTRRKPNTLTAAQREIHRRIEAQSEHSQNPPRPWFPEEYPELFALIESARAAAIARRKLRGRIVFNHAGKRYAARFTNLDRVIVEDWTTGRFYASSGWFAL